VFDPVEPDRLWMMDVTEHPTGDGKVYLAVVLDAFSRMVVGWSIADHMRAELVVDALQMALWRRRPLPGRTVAHADHGAQYTSWAFGRRLRTAGSARVDGLHRRRPRQQRGRELLRHPAARTPRPASVERPSTARAGDLRVDRVD
jgi:transposase InsO family protein